MAHPPPMHPELTAATAFLAAYLPPSSESPAPAFAAALLALLAARYRSHWHPHDPERGAAFRALTRRGAVLDPALVAAATTACVPLDAFATSLASPSPAPSTTTDPRDPTQTRLRLGDHWTLWIDPGCVSLRVDRPDPASSLAAPGPADGVLVEVYGALPPSLGLRALRLEDVTAAASSSSSSWPVTGTTTTTESPPLAQPSLPPLDSPTKRSSKAIQILRPALRAPSGSFRPPSSPSPSLLPPLPILSSPFITPPTPCRPSSSSTSDHADPSSPTSGAGHHHHRSSSRSSHSSSSSSAEHSDADSLFSTESLASSLTESLTLPPAAAHDEDDHHKPSLLPVRARTPSQLFTPTTPAFVFPPPRPLSAASHSHSSASNPSPTPYPTGRPTSPSKPRRRGTRGGGGGGSQHSAHGSSSSLSSLTSSSSFSAPLPSPSPSLSLSPSPSPGLLGPANNNNNKVTEYSGAKVGVLSGGVLLGLGGAVSLGSARGELVGEAKRRGRDRERRRVQPRLHVGAPMTGGLWPPLAAAPVSVRTPGFAPVTMPTTVV